MKTYTKLTNEQYACNENKTVRTEYNLSDLRGERINLQARLAEVEALIAELEKL